MISFMKGDRLRGLIAGAGKMGYTHAAAYKKIKGVSIAGILDKDAGRASQFAAVFGGKPVTTWEEALRLSPDFVDICLPTPFHKDAVLKCLQNGHDVICEKPLSTSLEDAMEIAGAVESSDRILMVAQVVRFWPEYAKLASIIRKGELNGIKSFTLSRYGARPDWSEGYWLLDDRKTGGILYDLCIHDIDFVIWLFGAPDRVYAHKSMIEPNYIGYMDIDLEYENMYAHVEGGFAMPGQYPFTAGFRISDGHTAFEYVNRSGFGLLKYDDANGSETVPCEASDPYENELRYFLEHLKSGRKPDMCTARDAIRTLNILKHIDQSIETGLVVEVPRT
jgi:predicted dehydrogenase